MSLSLDQARVLLDNETLQRVAKELRTVDIESVNEHKTGDYEGDKLVTEGLYWGLVRQVENWHRITSDKVKQLLA